MSNISVILNGYKRGKNLKEQVDALNSGSVKPSEIMLWYNAPEDQSEVNYEIMESVPTAFCNLNLGVWARFAFALNAHHEFVCVFDDDTIPGSRWLENCLTTINTHNGLLGTVGLLYPVPNPPEHSSYFERYVRFGWIDSGNNDKVVEVDLVGHSWFFRKEWLSHFWREIPDMNKYKIAREDMHFSYMLQKYAGIKTYVPPHPRNDKSLWGSIKGEYGGDTASLWENSVKGNNDFHRILHEAFREQRMSGWKLVNEK